ncbi:hypothetical protein AVEN_172055-1 [Araneus ventricosus]|uniref:Uncharacterized protein n=1 Tax=Araneus ventricosus TaxID=182803 RepID=A0A4Y2SG42_ARAVE|nr:hypothetical protein AVEN_172055-1 [Araneus ventricosus]
MDRAADVPLLPWSPRSTDLTPCDFFLCGYVKDKAYVPPMPTTLWEVLLKYSPLVLKKESDTRWSSRREAVTVVHKHLDKIVEALNHLPLDAVSSPEKKSVSVSLLKSIQTFEFVAFTCFW